MLEAVEAIEHVGEVARLFLVLTKWGQPSMEEQALVEACKRTAGLSTRYPRPRAAIAIAVSAGLLDYSRGIVKVTDRGRTFASLGVSSGPYLSHPQAKLLLGAFLDQTDFERGIGVFVSNFQLVRSQLVARKNSIQPSPVQLLLCRLLQQLGVVSTSGDYYMINRAFENLLARLVIRTAKLSQTELLQRLERQRERGELAEQKALEIERGRLKALKRPDLAAKVERISIYDVSAGYDIKSFETNERLRLIEVKSSVGCQISFEWSVNERSTADKGGDAYFVYFVPFSFALPDLVSPIVVLRNPMALVRSGHLTEVPTGFLVTEATSVGGTPKFGPPASGEHTTVAYGWPTSSSWPKGI